MSKGVSRGCCWGGGQAADQEDENEAAEVLDPFANVECQWHPRINVDFAKEDIRKSKPDYGKSIVQEESVLHVLNVHHSSSLQDLYKFLLSQQFSESKLRGTQRIKPRLHSMFNPTTDSAKKRGESAYFLTVGSMTTCRIEIKPKPTCVFVVCMDESEVKIDAVDVDRVMKFARLKSRSSVTGSLKVAFANEKQAREYCRDHFDGFDETKNLRKFESHTMIKLRIEESRREAIFTKKFSDKQSAESYARKRISDFVPGKDPHFVVVEEDDNRTASRVVDSLICVVREAQKDNAAIVIQDYATMSKNSVFIETALEEVEFDGPVINVILDSQIAYNEKTYGHEYPFSGQMIKKGILFKRVTHSFHISTGSPARFAARLLKILSGGYPVVRRNSNKMDLQLSFGPTNNKPYRYGVAIVASGGLAVLRTMAEIVREHIGLVILGESGRLCNYLPKVYAQRFSSKFNIYEASNRFCDECGIPRDTADAGRWVRAVVQDGNISIHQISSKLFALKRILNSIKHDDEALRNACKRYSEYTLAADQIEMPNRLLLYTKIVLSFIITLLATISTFVSNNSASLSSSFQNIQTALNQTNLTNNTNNSYFGLQITVTVLPIVLSVIMSIQQDFNYGPKLLALRYGAALVESEAYRYRTRTGKYSEQMIVSKMKKTQKEDEDQNEEEIFAYDTLNIRTQELSKELITIGAKVDIFDRPDDENDTKKKKKTRKTERRHIKMNIVLSKSEIELGVLSGDDYIKRAAEEGKDFERRADFLDKLLTVYKVLTYSIGALGSIFSLVGYQEWLTVSTAFLSAMVTLNSSSPLEQRVQMLRQAVAQLDDIQTQWQALPKERKQEQKYVDTLVENTELCLLAAETRPADFEKNANSIKFLFQFEEDKGSQQPALVQQQQLEESEAQLSKDAGPKVAYGEVVLSNRQEEIQTESGGVQGTSGDKVAPSGDAEKKAQDSPQQSDGAGDTPSSGQPVPSPAVDGNTAEVTADTPMPGGEPSPDAAESPTLPTEPDPATSAEAASAEAASAEATSTEPAPAIQEESPSQS